MPEGDAYLNNSFSYVYVETSAPPPVFTTPAPPNMIYVEKDCSNGQALSTNAASCDALLPDGQGVSIPPGVWPTTARAPVSVTLVSDEKSKELMTDAALQGALPISNVLYLQPTGTRFTLGLVTVRIKFDGNVLKSAGSRVLVVQRFNSTSVQWERVDNSSSTSQGNTTFALGETARFSYYGAFLALPLPPGPPTTASGNMLWNRLKYAEKVLIIVVPILVALCLVACFFYVRSKQGAEKPNLDLSFREAGVASPKSAYNHLQAAGEEGLLQHIRSIVREEVHEGLEVERQERSLMSQASNISNVSNFSDVDEDARPGGTIGDAHLGIM